MEIDPKQIEWRSDPDFVQTIGEALETITFGKKQHLQTTHGITKDEWSLAAEDAYYERATNPKPAKHAMPLRTAVGGGGLFNKVEPNEGEYMAGWRQQALTVPDRSIPALKHSKWLSGRAVCEIFPEPSLELMGPHHPVKDHIEKHVKEITHEVLTKGPMVGAHSAKLRLELKALDERKYGKGLPRWRPADAKTRAFNEQVFNKPKICQERELMLAARPARTDPRIPQMYTKKTAYFDSDLKLLTASGLAGSKKRR